MKIRDFSFRFFLINAMMLLSVRRGRQPAAKRGRHGGRKGARARAPAYGARVLRRGWIFARLDEATAAEKLKWRSGALGRGGARRRPSGWGGQQRISGPRGRRKPLKRLDSDKEIQENPKAFLWLFIDCLGQTGVESPISLGLCRAAVVAPRTRFPYGTV